MNYGLYLSASGVLTNIHRQDVFANNLANVNTVGFKPTLATISQRQPEAIEDRTNLEASNHLLERLGGGVLAGPNHLDFSVGAPQRTNNPLDVALTDRNSFFAVQETDPRTAMTQVRLTRSGQFTMNAQGLLVNQQGLPVLSVDDEPIELQRGVPAWIDRDGSVRQGTDTVARLQVASVDDPSQLRQIGQNLFQLAQGQERQIAERPSVLTEHVESSGVNPITATMQFTAASKAVTSNTNMIRYFDTVMDRAINTLGRVA